MVLKAAWARRVLFVIGLALIIFGSIGLALNTPWGGVANSLFAIFGTTMSFAQFSVGFSTLKPADSVSHDDAKPEPSLAQHAAAPSPAAWQPKAKLSASSAQIFLGYAQLTIGRAPGNQQVLNDAQVSGYHALIRPEEQGYTIMDLGSSNGTWVNGQRISAKIPQLLKAGDIIRIGTTRFTYEATPLAMANPREAYAQAPLPPTQQSNPPERLIAPPPPGVAAWSFPPPAGWHTPQIYRRSGIALLLAGIGIILYILIALLPLPAPLETFLTSAVFGLAFIAGLCGLRGFYAKQAGRGGWFGIIGTIMLTTGWILNVLISLITCVYVLSFTTNQPLSLGAFTLDGVFYRVNYIFLVAGDIIMGIGMIRAGVFPRWTGIALIVVGFLNLASTLSFVYPQSALPILIELVTAILVAILFCRLGTALMK